MMGPVEYQMSYLLRKKLTDTAYHYILPHSPNILLFRQMLYASKYQLYPKLCYKNRFIVYIIINSFIVQICILS